VQAQDVPQQQIDNALAYRDIIARNRPLYHVLRRRADHRPAPQARNPADRVALKLVRETDTGCRHSRQARHAYEPAYAEDVYIGGMSGVDLDGKRAGFIMPVGAPGVTILCRKPATRETTRSSRQLSLRYDELDGQMWLDDVLCRGSACSLSAPIPTRSRAGCAGTTLYGWLAKAEFSLGLALSLWPMPWR